MKSHILTMLILLFIGMIACEKNDANEEDKNQIVECESLPKWQGFDPDCGCFGEPFGFYGWCVPAKGGEVTYFAKTNFHHILDSLCLIYKPSLDELAVINVSETGYRSRELGATIKKSIDRQWKMIYEYTYSDIKDPSEDLQKSESKIIIDPNTFHVNSDELKIRAYRYRTGVPGKVILDSTEIVFIKQLNRK